MGKYFKERRPAMKKKILYILIVVVVLLFGICIIKINKEKNKQEEIVVDEIGHRIVFIIKRNQYGDTYEDDGYFIDNLGNRYYYDLSDQREFYYQDMNYEYKYLIEHIDDYEKETYLEKNQLYEAYKHLLMIDENAEIKEVCTGSADVGSLCYFGVRPDKDGEMEIILLEEYGDWEITNLDKNVDNIMEIIGRDNWERDIWERSNHYTD